MAQPDIYGQLPPELIGDQRALERQQQIADALMQQGMSPLGPGRMVGNTFVAPHWAEGLAKLGQAFAGNMVGNRVNQGRSDLGRRYEQMQADEIQRIAQMREGSTPRPQAMSPEDTAMIADQGGESAPMMQDVKGDPRAAVTAAITSRFAPVRELGKMQFQADLKKEEGAAQREARLHERILALDAAATNAALSREERAARAREAADLRRELQLNSMRMTQQIEAGRRQDRAAAEAARAEDRAARRADRAREIEQKRQDKLEATQGKQDSAKARVSTNLNALNDYYNELEALGAVVDSSKSTGSNISARVRASGVGQFLGETIGSDEQVYRNNINQMRPLLLQEIRQASAMGARGLDSNKELEFYLQAATDPKRDIKTNRAAMSVLEKAYGLGSMATGADPAAVSALQGEFKGAGTKAPAAAPGKQKVVDFNSLPPGKP